MKDTEFSCIVSMENIPSILINYLTRYPISAEQMATLDDKLKLLKKSKISGHLFKNIVREYNKQRSNTESFDSNESTDLIVLLSSQILTTEQKKNALIDYIQKEENGYRVNNGKKLFTIIYNRLLKLPENLGKINQDIPSSNHNLQQIPVTTTATNKARNSEDNSFSQNKKNTVGNSTKQAAVVNDPGYHKTSKEEAADKETTKLEIELTDLDSKTEKTSNSPNPDWQLDLLETISNKNNAFFEKILKANRHSIVKFIDKFGNTVIDAVVNSGNFYALRKIKDHLPKDFSYIDFLSIKNENSENIFHRMAANFNYTDWPQDLLDPKNDIEKVLSLLTVKNRDGLTPIHMACAVGNNKFLENIISKIIPLGKLNEEEVRLALKNILGSIDDAEGDTALHKAVKGGHIACVTLLLANYADPFVTNKANQNVYQLVSYLLNGSTNKKLIGIHDELKTNKQMHAITEVMNQTRDCMNLNISKLVKGKIKDKIKNHIQHLLTQNKDFIELINSNNHRDGFNNIIVIIANAIKYNLHQASVIDKKFTKNIQSPEYIENIIQVGVTQGLQSINNQPTADIPISSPTQSSINVFNQIMLSTLFSIVGQMQVIATGEYIRKQQMLNMQNATTIANAAAGATNFIGTAAAQLAPANGNAIQVATQGISGLINFFTPIVVGWLNKRKSDQYEADANSVYQALTKNLAGERIINFDEINAIVDMMTKRFEAFLTNRTVTQESVILLAKCICERIVHHLTQPQTSFQQHSIGTKFFSLVNGNVVSQKIFTLQERCLNALIQEREADSSNESGNSVINISNTQKRINQIIDDCPLKVIDEQGGQYYELIYEKNIIPSTKDIIPHALVTKEEADKAIKNRKYQQPIMARHIPSNVPKEAPRANLTSGTHQNTRTSKNLGVFGIFSGFTQDDNNRTDQSPGQGMTKRK